MYFQNNVIKNKAYLISELVTKKTLFAIKKMKDYLFLMIKLKNAKISTLKGRK